MTEYLQTAIWLDGRETPEQRKKYEDNVAIAMHDEAEAKKIEIGPIMWMELPPWHERVPAPPSNITGPNVRLLAAQATILGKKKRPNWFLSELEPKDLAVLRRVTRQAYAKSFPDRLPLTDRQCDTLISDLGPGVAVETLEKLPRSDLH